MITNTPASDTEKIVAYLQAQPFKRATSKQVRDVLGLTYPQLTAALKQLKGTVHKERMGLLHILYLAE